MAELTEVKQAIPWGNEIVVNILADEIYKYSLKQRKIAVSQGCNWTDSESNVKAELETMLSKKREWLCTTDFGSFGWYQAGWEQVLTNVREKLQKINEETYNEVELPEWISFWQFYCQPKLLSATITKNEEQSIKWMLREGTHPREIPALIPERTADWVTIQVERILAEEYIATIQKEAVFQLFKTLKICLNTPLGKVVEKLHTILPMLTFCELKVAYAEYQELIRTKVRQKQQEKRKGEKEANIKKR
ncbi:hypothetical protein QYM36_010467 [Artemia franciscana]|uniref:Uncharacterized protein n=1 Tax=Artemia franciscana TaxID=6661 RepID=A0AA88L1W8_ARTSF|nr:hypothetical protein QYM36_010467 [Artemia franciscana]